MISDGLEDTLVVLGRSDRIGGLSCFFVRAFIVSLAGEICTDSSDRSSLFSEDNVYLWVLT